VPGSLVASGFLFDLPKIFEDFVTVAISEDLQTKYGGTTHPQYPCDLDEAGAVSMRPDLVWQMDGRPTAVVDAKYKQEKSDRYPNADLYQLLAYCTALGLSRGHLVYAKGNAEAARHLVRNTTVDIVCHALDLTLPPDHLLSQVSKLTDQLASATFVG
jgi:5-methylcytosine-specific restriction enzyme subunit McrC